MSLSSRCVYCGEHITLDDWRMAAEGGWAHAECAQQEREMRRRRERQEDGQLIWQEDA